MVSNKRFDPQPKEQIMDFYEKIKALRQQRGLSLQAVGDIVGVGKSTVRKWENGDIKNMGRDKIELLAKALGVEPAYLMGWEEPEQEDIMPSPEEWKLLHGLRKMPSQKARIIMDMILAGINSERNDADDSES